MSPSGLAQRLMRSRSVPLVYERWWRPVLGRVAKGRHGPSMADEHALAIRGLGVRPGDTVLDVACGTGAFTRCFADAVGPDGLAIGLDASPTMLARATRQERCAYVRADAARPPLPPGSVDGVCCYAALHLFDDPESVLAAFAEVLRPGGRLALLTSARRAALPYAIVDAGIALTSGMRMFDRDEVQAMLHRGGFTDVAVDVHGVTQFVTARKPPESPA